jgi:hypothetical protein
MHLKNPLITKTVSSPISPSPLRGEGRDEGGFDHRRHPAPYPSPYWRSQGRPPVYPSIRKAQGARVYFAGFVKSIVPLFCMTWNIHAIDKAPGMGIPS